ncbi:LysR family transcriptional regulator [Fodinicola feengrottensis]|uniref:LysR family transcriptional regulator n=1 Tax=Fodinicola feengrottensis TaxID=435914 RepID=A0ABN2GPE6_9ACTN
MELRHFRYFLIVAEELHFGRAAARLHVSTPTLSQQIRAVEREIGTPLLVRGAREVTLTAAGKVLLVEARKTVQAAEDAIRATRTAAGIVDPVLRLGLLNGSPDWLVSRLVDRAVAGAPGSQVILVSGTTAEQVRLLGRGEVDLAVVRLPVGLPAGCEQVELYDEEIGILMSYEHPLAAQQVLAPADVAGVEVIMYPRELGPGAYDAVLERLRSLGAAVIVSDSKVNAAQWQRVLPLRPKAVVLSSARAAAEPEVVWRPLAGRPLSIVYAGAWRPGSRNPVLRALVQQLRRKPLAQP